MTDEEILSAGSDSAVLAQTMTEAATAEARRWADRIDAVVRAAGLEPCTGPSEDEDALEYTARQVAGALALLAEDRDSALEAAAAVCDGTARDYANEPFAAIEAARRIRRLRHLWKRRS
jgi:hypothetical protein